MPLIHSFLIETHLDFCLCDNNSQILCPGCPHTPESVKILLYSCRKLFPWLTTTPRECQSSNLAAFLQILWIPNALWGCCECQVSCIFPVYGHKRPRSSQYVKVGLQRILWKTQNQTQIASQRWSNVGQGWNHCSWLTKIGPMQFQPLWYYFI